MTNRDSVFKRNPKLMTISASGSYKLESRCNLQTAPLTLLGPACVCSLSLCTVDLITFVSRPEQLCGVTLNTGRATACPVLGGGASFSLMLTAAWGDEKHQTASTQHFGLHYTDCCGGWTLMWLLSECSLLGQNQELAGFSAAATLCMHEQCWSSASPEEPR